MLNEVFNEAAGLAIPVPSKTLAGSPVRVGILNFVTITDEGSTTDATNVVRGVPMPTGGVGNLPGWASGRNNGAFRFPVTGVVTAYGPVYIKADNTLTSVPAGAFLYGSALEAKAGATVGKVVVKILQPGQVTANA